MRTIKSLFMVLVAVLLSVSIASAVTDLTANGTTIVKPSKVDGVIAATVFDDVRVPSGTGTTGATYWSNPIDISNLDFTRGSNRDNAYITVGWAHANTETSSYSGITVTYQLSHDGKNFFPPKCLTGAHTAVNQGYLGIFASSTSDGFDGNEGSGWKSAKDTITAPSVAGGAGPYCPTNTAIRDITLTQARYIRFQVWGETNLNIGDLFFMGAARQTTE